MMPLGKLDPIQMALTKQRTIEIAGDVDKEMAFYIRNALMILSADGNPDIQVNFSSGGGSVGWGLDIYDMIRLYPGKKTGLVLGPAYSMAAIILQGCAERQCAKHGAVLIHHINTQNLSLDVLRNKKKLEAKVAQMERDQDRLYSILSERTRQPLSKIKRVCVKDEPMNPDAALKFGLIDKIV